MRRELRIGNFYVDRGGGHDEIFTMVVHEVQLPADFVSEQEYLDYLETELLPLTGTGRTQGHSFYTVRSIDDIEPAINLEFG